MDWEGIFYCAVFLILISPCAWHLWRQLDRSDLYPTTTDGKVDVEALLARYGFRKNPVLSEHERRIEIEDADYYRERFRTAPVGEWYVHGQEPMLMGEDWTFHPNHTGEVMRTEAFGYPRERTLFQWREAGDHTIEVLVSAREACVSCAPQGPPMWGPHPDWVDDEETEPKGWERVQYDFRRVEEPRLTVVMHRDGHADFFALGCLPLAPLEWRVPLGHSGAIEPCA